MKNTKKSGVELVTDAPAKKWYFPEENRPTIPVKLRLMPAVVQHLKDVAAEQEMTISKLVEKLLMDLDEPEVVVKKLRRKK